MTRKSAGVNASGEIESKPAPPNGHRYLWRLAAAPQSGSPSRVNFSACATRDNASRVFLPTKLIAAPTAHALSKSVRQRTRRQRAPLVDGKSAMIFCVAKLAAVESFDALFLSTPAICIENGHCRFMCNRKHFVGS